jgi:hypothetical protein
MINFKELLESSGNDMIRACDTIRSLNILESNDGPKNINILLSSKKSTEYPVKFVTLERNFQDFAIGYWFKDEEGSAFKRKDVTLISDLPHERVLKIYFETIEAN